jgi:hypothetical protein
MQPVRVCNTMAARRSESHRNSLRRTANTKKLQCTPHAREREFTFAMTFARAGCIGTVHHRSCQE